MVFGITSHKKNTTKQKRKGKGKSKEKKKRKRKKSKRNHEKLLPTAQNRTGNLPSRVVGQCLYHDVFSTYMPHFVQDDIYHLKDVIQDFMTTSSLVQRGAP
jgi:hypothetical protein